MTTVARIDLADLIARHRFRYASERDVQDGVAAILERFGIDYLREYRLSARDRIDFYVPSPDGHGTGIEVKVGGSLSDLTRQLYRYAEDERVGSLVLIATVSRLAQVPRVLAGKPVRAVIIRSLT